MVWEFMYSSPTSFFQRLNLFALDGTKESMTLAVRIKCWSWPGVWFLLQASPGFCIRLYSVYNPCVTVRTFHEDSGMTGR